MAFILQVGGAGERGDDDSVHAAAPAGDGRAVGGGEAAGLGRGERARGDLLRLRGRRRGVQARRRRGGGARERAGAEAMGTEVRVRAGHRREHRAHREPRPRVIGQAVSRSIHRRGTRRLHMDVCAGSSVRVVYMGT